MTLPKIESPKTVSIDNVTYLASDLSPEIMNLMSLMDTANKKLVEAQTEATMRAAAYNQFGSMLRQKLQHIQPALTLESALEKPKARRKAPVNNTKSKRRK